eukprot:1386421-Prymnesium_polylepis.2
MCCDVLEIARRAKVKGPPDFGVRVRRRVVLLPGASGAQGAREPRAASGVRSPLPRRSRTSREPRFVASGHSLDEAGSRRGWAKSDN